MDNEVRIARRADGIIASRVMATGVWRDKIMSQAEAEERFLIGGRKPKWRRMLRALWRVKNA